MLHKLWYTLRHAPVKALADYHENRARQKIAAIPELYTLLQTYIGASGSTGCEWRDYWALYTYVRTHKPKEILECGTGVSTVVLAYALAENESEGGAPGRITSMEELPEYYELAKQLFPQKFVRYVDLRLSPAVQDTYLFFTGVRYRDIPERQYDFVFVDGPNYTVDRIALFDLDYLYVLARSQTPVGAMVDTRTSTCWVFHTLLPHKFRYNYVKKIGYVEPAVARDLPDTLHVVARAMGRHAFHRTPLRSYVE